MPRTRPYPPEFRRQIVELARGMANHLRTELSLEPLNMAIWRRRPDTVVHRSDQGTQYTSMEFGKRCRGLGVVPSTGSVGDCFDNAVAESFFATLETALLWRETFKTQAAARLAVFDFIEGFYNPRRRHSSNGRLAPAEYERRFFADRDIEVETAVARLPRAPTTRLLRVPKIQALRCPRK